DDVCSKPSVAGYFPNTCAAVSFLQNGQLGYAGGLGSLQRPVEQDFRFLPACLLKRPPSGSRGTNVGYVVYDALRQLASGRTTKTGNIMWALSAHPVFSDECRRVASSDPSSTPCRMFEAMTAVKAAFELAESRPPEEERLGAFFTLFFFGLSEQWCNSS